MLVPLLFVFFSAICVGQRIQIQEAPLQVMPGQVDSNSPAFWQDGQFNLYNSTGDGPLLSKGPDQFRLERGTLSAIARQRPWPTWIEAVWVDPTGVILAWYHQEHENVCGAQRPAQPWIGAAMSYDGGKKFFDAGIILSSNEPVDCSSQNGYFAGGHGDFSVVLDREQKYFYFLFSNYGGPVASQGVVIARMAYEDRFHPVGSVLKYHEGQWTQPGVGGRVTALFPAKVSWQKENTDSFWGPSIHWNTHLQSYVVLMNRSCCTTGFPQEGIYAAFNADLSNPSGWTKPKKILGDVGWYPQVLGTGPRGTDSLVGKEARLYVYGQSRWKVIFRRPKPNTSETNSDTY